MIDVFPYAHVAVFEIVRSFEVFHMLGVVVSPSVLPYEILWWLISGGYIVFVIGTCNLLDSGVDGTPQY